MSGGTSVTTHVLPGTRSPLALLQPERCHRRLRQERKPSGSEQRDAASAGMSVTFLNFKSADSPAGSRTRKGFGGPGPPSLPHT